jgi:hypothetical protein
MATVDEVPANAEAYAFRYPFDVGHELNAARVSEFRIEAERSFGEVRLFLTGDGLVDPAHRPMEDVQTNVALDLVDEELRPLPLVQWSRTRTLPSHRLTPGVTLSIPAGTEIGLLPSPEQPSADAVTVRFPHQTIVEIGGWGTMATRWSAHMRPVVLNGLPQVEVVRTDDASLELATDKSRVLALSLLIVVSPYQRRGETALYHLTESIGNRVVGGVSIQVPV